MRGRVIFCCFVVVVVQMVSWAVVTSRPFAPNDGVPNQPGTGGQSSPEFQQVNLSSTQDYESRGGLEEEEASDIGVNKIGSSPPSCAHKCYGCMPCEATQVPTTTGRVGVQYANYEPEGWKCKCGPAFYSP